VKARGAGGRGPEAERRQRLYRTARWQRLRARVLAEEPRCRACGKPATIVDHTAGHAGDWRSRFFDRGNLAAMCQSCHSSKTASSEMPGRGGALSRKQGPFRGPPPEHEKIYRPSSDSPLDAAIARILEKRR
jgi:5-methylcytosine-specific restriction endonuclease McrA